MVFFNLKLSQSCQLKNEAGYCLTIFRSFLNFPFFDCFSKNVNWPKSMKESSGNEKKGHDLNTVDNAFLPSLISNEMKPEHVGHVHFPISLQIFSYCISNVLLVHSVFNSIEYTCEK